MASEFLYILCAGYQVWVAREGGTRTRLGSTIPIHPLDRHYPPLSTQLAQPRLQSQSQLCLTRHDISSKTQETTLETTVLQPPSRISAQHFYHTTPARSPFVPTIMLHFILDKLNCVPTLRPLQDSPCTTYSRWIRLKARHVETRYLKRPVPRGTYCNTLYSIHSRYIYSLYQHIQITPRDNVYIQVAILDTSRTEGSMENVV